MASTAKSVLPDFATTAGRTMFTVAANRVYTLSEISLANIDDAEHEVTIFHLDDGETIAEEKRIIFPAATVKAHMVVEGARGKVFEEGHMLVVVCDEDDVVTCSASYDDEEAA